MTCPSCGHPLAGGTYCSNCGTAIVHLGTQAHASHAANALRKVLLSLWWTIWIVLGGILMLLYAFIGVCALSAAPALRGMPNFIADPIWIVILLGGFGFFVWLWWQRMRSIWKG